MRRLIPFIFFAFIIACNNESNDSTTGSTASSAIPPPAVISYNIVASYPHDTASYTQGLIYKDNALYEGTGMEGKSRLMQVDLNNGKAIKSVQLSSDVFGEGITILNDKIYQLTWQNHKVFVYDLKTFEKIKEHQWPHDGWGITDNGKELIISTGESNIYFVDPETFNVKRVVGVMDQNGPVGNLNELEYVDGSLFSNIYLTDYIVKIDPETGHIIGKMDLSGLLEKSGQHVNVNEGRVLNGIAYDSTKNSLYVTGKNWPLLYELKLN